MRQISKPLIQKLIPREALKMYRSQLVAFDFDHTITEDNTDVVVRKLLPEEKLPESVKELYRSNGWIGYMGKIFELLHHNSIDAKQIEQAIVDIPPVLGIENLLKELYAHNCEIIIISDSNSIFIDQWLRSRKLNYLITRIFTNPARIDESGMMKIDMYHVQNWCKFSTINLCKGHILESYIKQRASEAVHFDRIVYIGDGKNDLCPILKLSENDLAFSRVGYVLAKLLTDTESTDRPAVKAQVHFWNSGTDILEKILETTDISKNSL